MYDYGVAHMVQGLFYCCRSITEAAVDSEVYCIRCRNRIERTGYIEEARPKQVHTAPK